MIEPLLKQIKEYENKKNIIYTKIGNIRYNRNETVKTDRKEFICKCPNNDCIGYLSTQYKCGLCNNSYCPNCNELKVENHICNNETVETIKLLNKECKKCPKCHVNIYKIDGCDMMWCVSCHVAFSWRTLQILNGQNIHNPHYFQWLSQQNGGITVRNPNDILCGREIDNNFSRLFLLKIKNVFELGNIILYNYYEFNNNSPTVRNQYKNLSIEKQNGNNIYISFDNLLRSILHIRFVDLETRVDNRDLNVPIQSRELRMSFMEKYIDEKQFKDTLESRKKKFDKNNEITILLRMYVNCITEILYRIYNNISKENVKEYNIEIDNLKKYVNDQFLKISKIYNCVCYKIHPYECLIVGSYHNKEI